MAVAQAMWIHGNAVRIEDPDQVSGIWRSGAFFRLVGVRSGHVWIHYAIPTPVIVTDRRLTAGSVMVRCRMVPQEDAWIEAVHIYDGESRIAARDGLRQNSSDWSFHRYEVPGTPEVRWGVGVSIKLKFTDRNYLGENLREAVLRNPNLGLSDIEFRLQPVPGVGLPATPGTGGSGPPAPRAPDLHYAVEVGAVGCDFLS